MQGPVLVDSNVLLDIISEDPVWLDWSAGKLAEVGDAMRLAINPIVYAEVSAGFACLEEVDARLPEREYLRLPLPWPAAFLAGQAFLAYRRAGGPRRSPLPDFYVGAHAAAEGMTLLTRDPSRYRTYFPALELIAP